MFDDHFYCERRGKHERSCWCFDGRPPDLLAADLAEARERDALCTGHPIAEP